MASITSATSGTKHKRLLFEQLEDRRLLAVMTEVPVVGGVTEDIARIFLRTDEAASVAIEYSTTSTFQTSSVSPAQFTIAADDFTRIIEIDSLQAETTYYYRILVDEVAQQTSNFPSFTTFPTEGTTQDFNFTVFSDVGSPPKFPFRSAPAYAQAASEDPSFVLQIGDLDHRDPPDLAAMRTMNRETRSPDQLHGADFAENILSSYPLYRAWDDHDYGLQDGDKNFAGREDAWQAFQEYFPTPDLPNPSAGIWYSFIHAQAEFFMLDLRSQRDPQADPDDANKSMLDGDNIVNGQKDWLFDGLLNSTADWKFVITSVPFNPRSKRDAWRSYQTEAAEIVNFIEQNDITGVVLISGDLHSGGAIDDGTNSFLPEIAVPHTNLSRGDSGPRGLWSEGYTSGDDISGGYLSVQVLTNPGRVIFETKDSEGNVTVSWQMDITSPPPSNNQTVYLSLDSAGELTNSDGSTISYTESDILELTRTGANDFQFAVYFDGSDVGLERNGTDTNLDAFDILSDGTIVLSASKRLRLNTDYASPGSGSGPLVRPGSEDLMRFTPSSLGEETTGSWSFFLDSSTVGVTNNINAVSVLDDGSIVVSTDRTFTAGTVEGRGEDLFRYDPAAGTWEQYFDGGDAQLARRREFVDALSIDQTGASGPRLNLSTFFVFGVTGISGGPADVFAYNSATLGENTSGIYDSIFTLLGSDYGLDGLQIDGFDLGAAVLPSSSTSLAASKETLLGGEIASSRQAIFARDRALEELRPEKLTRSSRQTPLPQEFSDTTTASSVATRETNDSSRRKHFRPRSERTTEAQSWRKFRQAQVATPLAAIEFESEIG